jgi:hypothetical protein
MFSYWIVVWHTVIFVTGTHQYLSLEHTNIYNVACRLTVPHTCQSLPTINQLFTVCLCITVCQIPLSIVCPTFNRVSFRWTTRVVKQCWSFDNLTTSLHTLKTMWGPDTLRSVTDSTEQFVWCLIHMWSMLHVISVICYLMCICIYTSYYCELVVGLRHSSTPLDVWGGWELGCWHLTYPFLRSKT